MCEACPLTGLTAPHIARNRTLRTGAPGPHPLPCSCRSLAPRQLRPGGDKLTGAPTTGATMRGPRHMAADHRLGGRTRTRINAEVRARTHAPVCPMCQYPIDRSLPRTGIPHPLSSVIDEWVPRSKGGQVDPGNCVEMHRACNGIKHDRYPITLDLHLRCRDKVEQLLELHITPGQTLERPW